MAKKRGTNCLWCGDQLSVLKRLASVDYCCDEHRKEYYNEGQRIMFDRLVAYRLRLPVSPMEEETFALGLTA